MLESNLIYEAVHYIIPALIPLALFITAEIYSWRKQDERQQMIRHKAYKHSFAVLVSAWFILYAADAYYAGTLYSKDRLLFSGCAPQTALVLAIGVLITEQIVRGSFFTSESTLGFIIFTVFAAPFTAFVIYATAQGAAFLEDLHEPVTYASFSVVLCAVSVVIIIAAVVKQVIFVARKDSE